jgi:hypothetical protein
VVVVISIALLHVVVANAYVSSAAVKIVRERMVPEEKPLVAKKPVTATSYHSYTKIHALGHHAITELFLEEVILEEKVDGSQFSFGVFDFGEGPELRARSKGAQINLIAPEKLFIKAVETILKLQPNLKLGWTYRAEYLSKPKHHTRAYGRVPKDHLIIFDISPSYEQYLSPEEKKAEADRIGLECVPCFFRGKIDNYDVFRKLVDETMSVLGEEKIEGVVVKNYNRFGSDGKAMMGKFVSEEFKEKHGVEWKESNPKQGDILQKLIMSYQTPARWSKAVMHLEERGELENAPKDIGKLIKEVHKDLTEEEAKGPNSPIAEALLKWALPKILRGATAGLPEWYKEELAKRQFAK